MEENNSFTTSDVAFAKIVPTPTLVSWSQAYHAGKLFAVLSLTKKEPPEDVNALGLLGKEILNTLEQEYFVIEDKNLITIKQAIVSACEKIPSDVTCSFVVGSMIKTALYVFVFGKGKIILKRNDKIGTVLTNDSALENPEVISASGLLENHDTIVFQTQKFLDVVTQDALSSALSNHNTPSEIAETLTPRVHGQEAGDACAIIVSYVQEEEEQESEASVSNQNKIASLANKLKIIPRLLASVISKLPIRRKTEFSTRETRSKKLFLTVAAILAIVLVASIAFVVKKQNDQKTQALFGKTFESAKTKYDEGQSLLSLNKNLAREDLEEAKKIINNAKPKFQKGSKEEKQIGELLKKIEEQLSIASAVNTVQPKQVDAKESMMLSYRIKNDPKEDKGIFFSQDANNVYTANNKEVSVIDKKTEKTKSLFKNGSDWSSLGGIGTYLTNIYILDKENGVHKFVPTEKEYSKTNYFAAGVSPDLSNSSSMAVDTSIWVLLDDGKILKFTRGKPESFNVNGLDQPLSKPLRIFTNTDTDNLYILDRGNSRIVVFKKNGDYESQYQANVLKDAVDFDVLESSKKIFILSKEKIYEIGIK